MPGIAEENHLEKLLRERIIPWVSNSGMTNIFVAHPSWLALQQSTPALPPGATVTPKPLRGKRVRSRIQRTHGKLSIEQYRWPQDKLLSARAPKLCFVTEGPIAFQIADYVLHCNPAHGILLPSGTPFPDGTLKILDTEREHHNACEVVMILPRQGSLSCWTSRQTYDVQGRMSHHSETFSILQSQVTPCLHQLVDEVTHRQLHWQSVGDCVLRALVWKTNPYDSAEKGIQFLARVETAEESNALIRRDTGAMLAQGQGAWWYDMEGGWFNDPAIMKAVAESTTAFQMDFKNDSAPRAEVAVFVDEYSLDCINRQNTWTYQNALSEQIRQLNSSGVPFHIYLQSDLENPALPDYKLYVFLNAYHLTPDNMQPLQKLRQNGKTLCFMHAPGVISDGAQAGSTPAAAIARVTGIAVQANESQNLLLQPVAGSTLGGETLVSYGHNQTRSPFAAPTFSVTDAQAKRLAVYQDGGKTAVALRDFGNWKSVFYGGIGIDAFFFNALAREAGAWVAAPAGNAVYANQNFLTIHALSPGEKTVQFLEPSKVTDLADGKLISPRTQSLNFSMKLGETRWFSLQQP